MWKFAFLVVRKHDYYQFVKSAAMCFTISADWITG